MLRLVRPHQLRGFQTAAIHCRDVFVWDKAVSRSEWRAPILHPASPHAVASYAVERHRIMDHGKEAEFSVGFSAVEPLYLPKTCENLIGEKSKEAGSADEHCLIVFPEANFVPGLKKSDVRRIVQQLEDPTKHVEEEGLPLSQLHLFVQTMGLTDALNKHQLKVAEWIVGFVREHGCDWCVWETSGFGTHRQAATVLIMPNHDAFAHLLTKDAVYRACEAVLKDAMRRS